MSRRQRDARCEPTRFRRSLKDVVSAATVAITIDYLNGLAVRKAVAYLAGVMSLYTLLYASACTVLDFSVVDRGQGAILDGSLAGLALIQALATTNDPWMMYEVVRMALDARLDDSLPPSRVLGERLRVYRQQPFQLLKWLEAPGETSIHVRFWDTDTSDLAETMEASRARIEGLRREIEAYALRPVKPTPLGRRLYQLARSLVERTRGFERRVIERLELNAKRLKILL